MADEKREEKRAAAEKIEEVIVVKDGAAPAPNLAMLGKPDPEAIGATAEFAVSTGGRRDADEQTIVVEFERKLRDAFFWLFGMFLETRAPHKPSISRISWWIIVMTGVAMFAHEMLLTSCAKLPAVSVSGAAGARAWQTFAHELGHCGVPISNAAWQAWAAAFAACSVAVLGPKMIEFWKNGGIQAISSIGASLRDNPREPSPLDDERKDK